MKVRIVYGQAKLESVDELARIWKDTVAETLGDEPGRRAGYFTVDRNTGRTAVISIWEPLPDASVFQPMAQLLAQRSQGMMEGQVTVEVYEVLEEVGPS